MRACLLNTTFCGRYTSVCFCTAPPGDYKATAAHVASGASKCCHRITCTDCTLQHLDGKHTWPTHSTPQCSSTPTTNLLHRLVLRTTWCTLSAAFTAAAFCPLKLSLAQPGCTELTSACTCHCSGLVLDCSPRRMKAKASTERDSCFARIGLLLLFVGWYEIFEWMWQDTAKFPSGSGYRVQHKCTWEHWHSSRLSL